jgi:S-adenosylmethionine:tRNA ribosyltransferase-isomerase
LSDFDYELPNNLIATYPNKKRDHSRLLILKKNGKLEDKKFFNIINYLNKGDILVLNNSKVIPARLLGQKESGGKVEILLHQKM